MYSKMSGVRSNRFCFQAIKYLSGPSMNESNSISKKNELMTIIRIDKKMFADLNRLIRAVSPSSLSRIRKVEFCWLKSVVFAANESVTFKKGGSISISKLSCNRIL